MKTETITARITKADKQKLKQNKYKLGDIISYINTIHNEKTNLLIRNEYIKKEITKINSEIHTLQTIHKSNEKKIKELHNKKKVINYE